MNIGMIVSTGFQLNEIAENWEEQIIETVYGVIPFKVAKTGNSFLYATHRNGFSKSCPPHKVNYRGIISAFRKLNVSHILATSVVGSLRTEFMPGQVVVLDQFIDFTKQRDITFFGDEGFAFCDFTEPYCPDLRRILIESSKENGISYIPTGCYVGVDGPRYETAAEVKMFGLLGGDVIGMTNLPEAILAREAGICYSSAALIVNYGAGLASKVTREDCYEETLKHIGQMEAILKSAVNKLQKFDQSCDCANVPNDMIMIPS